MPYIISWLSSAPKHMELDTTQFWLLALVVGGELAVLSDGIKAGCPSRFGFRETGLVLSGA